MASSFLPSAHPGTSTSSAPASYASLPTNSSQEEDGAQSPDWVSPPIISGRPAIIEVSADRPWYQRRGWLFVKAQLERSLATGQWGPLIWKLKYHPNGREYYLPVHIEQLYNVIPGHTAHPTLEEVQEFRFLELVSQKIQQDATERFNLARKRYEENHGHPWDPRRPPTASAAAAASSDEEDAKQSAPQLNEQKERTQLDCPVSGHSEASNS